LTHAVRIPARSAGGRSYLNPNATWSTASGGSPIRSSAFWKTTSLGL
jgi:hypothetical protein